MGTISKIQWSIGQRGILGTLHSAMKSFARKLLPAKPSPRHPFDEQHGVDTGGLIAGHDLGMGSPRDRFITGYAGIPPSSFAGAMHAWRISEPAHPISKYSFIDLGCGKGRAVLLASQLGFREAVGVELNRGLADIALANVIAWTAAEKAHCPIRIVCGDALDFAWPDGPILVYLYNPFGEPVVQALTRILEARFSENPAGLEVIYQKSEHAAVFEKGFNLIWRNAIAISAADLRSELVADPGDESCGFRLPLEIPRRD